MIWLLYSALVAATVYELHAAISREELTISQLTWRLEGHHRIIAIFLMIGYLVLFYHLFIQRSWL